MRTRAGKPSKVAQVRVAGAVLAGVLGAGLLGGCGGDTPSRPPHTTPTPSSTSAAPSPVPTVEPVPTAPAAAAGRAGQQAFAHYVMTLWAYTLRTNDPRALTALSFGKKPCEGCAALGREAARRRSQGWHVDFPGVKVRSIALTRQGAVRVARALVDIPETASYNTDGSFRNTNAAHPGATFEVRMRHSKSHYRLVSFTVS
jgi:hypothetical protein